MQALMTEGVGAGQALTRVWMQALMMRVWMQALTEGMDAGTDEVVDAGIVEGVDAGTDDEGVDAGTDD